MAQDDHADVATRALRAFATAEQLDQASVLVDVIVAFPACRMHAWRAIERSYCEPGVFGECE